jgi:hypothetical protein
MGATAGQIDPWIWRAEDRRGASSPGWAGFLGPDRADGRSAGERTPGGWRRCVEVPGSRCGFEEVGDCLERRRKQNSDFLLGEGERVTWRIKTKEYLIPNFAGSKRWGIA